MADTKKKDERNGSGLSRREFIGAAAGAALISNAVFNAACISGSPEHKEALKKRAVAPVLSDANKPGKKPRKRARVVLIRDKNALGPDNKPRDEVLAAMLDKAVSELVSLPTAEAWRKLIQPNDVLGIKSNEWRFLATPPGLEQAIKNQALKVGISEDRVSITDRNVLEDPVFQKATALVNIRPMRTHHWSGVGSCIKNYIVFSDDKPSWHEDSCANLAGLWDLPAAKGKTRLNILVMLTPLFHGKGPHHFQAEYTWPYSGLLIGTDPVAVDATGVRILKEKRKAFFGKDEPLTVSPKHIEVADTKFGLGVSSPDMIDVVKMGWLEEALI